MLHIYDGILLGHRKEYSLTICDSIEGPRGYCAKCYKSKTEIPHEFTDMWNLNNKINEQNRYRLRHRIN